MAAVPPIAPPLPPGGLLEIVFSFDTTGSMSSILEEVQGRLQDMIQRLQADIAGIRIGVIAHGDYCDKDVFYLTKELDFCTDVVELCNFVNGVEGTGGGDQDECYELILRMVRQNFSWTAGSQKILVMIGDANPHEPDYELNVDNIDWRQEIKKLSKMGVKIYGVQAFEHEGADDFYRAISSNTDGHYLKLGDFSNICDFLMAICYRERGEDLFTGYEAEVRIRYGRHGIDPDLEEMFGTLRRTDSGRSITSDAGPSSSGTTPVAPLTKVPSVARVSPMMKQVSLKKKTSQFKKELKRKPVGSSTSKVQNKKMGSKTSTSKKTADKSNFKRRNTTAKGKKESDNTRPRERTSPAKFVCSSLDWSPWQLAYTPANITELVPKRGQFSKRNRGRCLKRVELFARKTRAPCLYEVSVQMKKRRKYHVMYFKVLLKQLSKNNWDRELFCGGRRRIVRQINSVLDQGCRVYVRRALLPRKRKRDSTLKALAGYSYAWNRQRNTKGQRPVRVNSVVLSE